jgi:hypothetical protein
MLVGMRLSSQYRYSHHEHGRTEALAWVEMAALVVVDEHPVG